MVARGWEGERVTVGEYRDFLWGDENVLELDTAEVSNFVNILNT